MSDFNCSICKKFPETGGLGSRELKKLGIELVCESCASILLDVLLENLRGGMEYRQSEYYKVYGMLLKTVIIRGPG